MPQSRVSLPTAALLSASLSLVGGCGEGDAGPATGAVRDSAGIRVIDLPAPDAGVVRTPSVDPGWDPAGDRELGDLVDVALDGDGRMYLVDVLPARIVVLDPSGESRTLGREGEGPGEFIPRGRSRLVVTHSSVLVPDVTQQRITEFDRDGEVLAVHPFPAAGFLLDWRSHPDGGLAYRGVEDEGDRIERWDGSRVDTLQRFEAVGASGNAVMPPVPLWDVLPGGGLVLGNSEAPSVSRPGGGAPWIAHLPLRGREFSEDDEEALLDVVAESLRLRGVEIPRDRLRRDVRLPPTAPPRFRPCGSRRTETCGYASPPPSKSWESTNGRSTASSPTTSGGSGRPGCSCPPPGEPMWFRRKRPPDDATGELRARVLSGAPDELGLGEAADGDGPWAAVMEMGYPDAVVTLVALADHTTSLYFSSGGGVIGGGAHRTVRDANAAFRDAAEALSGRLEAVSRTPPPDRGEVVFYVRRGEETLSGGASEDALGEGRHALAPLFQAGQRVIAAIREATPGEA